MVSPTVKNFVFTNIIQIVKIKIKIDLVILEFYILTLTFFKKYFQKIITSVHKDSNNNNSVHIPILASEWLPGSGWSRRLITWSG